MSKKNYTIAKSKALLNRYGDVLVRGYIPHKNIFGQVDMDYPAFVQRASQGRDFGMWMAMNFWIM